MPDASSESLSATIGSLLAAPASPERDDDLHKTGVALFDVIGARGDRAKLAKMAAAFAAATGGNTAALIDHARCLWNGWGVPQDWDSALAAYLRAGELGSDYKRQCRRQ